MYRCFLDLAVWPAHRVVKVDDTVPGLLEGRHAGCWTVAVIVSGNEMGLTPAEWAALTPAEQSARRQQAEGRLSAAQADDVVDTVADLPAVLDRIQRRSAAGERPPAVGASAVPGRRGC